jgi:competence protein ComEC
VQRLDGPRHLRVRLDGRCSEVVRVRLPSQRAEGQSSRSSAVAPDSPHPGLLPGHRVAGHGVWVSRQRWQPALDPVFAGELRPVAQRGLGPAPGLRAALDRRRDHLATRIRARFTREAAMVEALIVARRGGLDPATREAFVRSGTAHLLAISGFHVGLLAGIALLVLGWWTSPLRAAAGATLAAWGYVAMLGLPDAAVRAALLLTVFTAGRLFQRPVRASGALGTALILMVVADPSVAGRVGAQLSFVGALALAVGVGPAERVLRGLKNRNDHVGPSRWSPAPRGASSVLSALAAALAATFVTLPLVAWHFGTVSLVGIPATLLVTPLVALSLPGIVGVLALDTLSRAGSWVASLSAHLAAIESGALVPLLDKAIAAVATGVEGLLGLSRRIVAYLAAPEFASIAVEPLAVPLALGALALAVRLARGQARVGLEARVAVALMGALAGLMLTPAAHEVPRRNSFEFHMLDAGQGDALAVRSPAGRWMVIDAGPPGTDRVARQLTRLGIRRIDVLVVTHPDADHVGGVPELLRQFEVAAIAGPGTPRGQGPWREAVTLARSLGIPWRRLATGDAFSLDAVHVRVVHPAWDPRPATDSKSVNHRSVVLHVRWADLDVLLTGDADLKAEARFAAAVGDIDVLKVGHHGSRTSTGPELLAATRPKVALISAGRGNRFGHPHPSVLERLDAAGVAQRRTDLEGAVRIVGSPDGRWRWVARGVD